MIQIYQLFLLSQNKSHTIIMSRYDKWDVERVHSELPATLLESAESSPRYSWQTVNITTYKNPRLSRTWDLSQLVFLFVNNIVYEVIRVEIIFIAVLSYSNSSPSSSQSSSSPYSLTCIVTSTSSMT